MFYDKCCTQCQGIATDVPRSILHSCPIHECSNYLQDIRWFQQLCQLLMIQLRIKKKKSRLTACGSQNGISKGYAATRALGLTKVPNIPLKQVAN